MEHHVGIDHLVPNEFFLKKLKEAIAARSDPNLLIIARTNALRIGGIEEAVRRGETYRKAGADLVFCYTRSAGELRFVAERIAPPLMMFAPADGFGSFPLKQGELAAMGYRLAASSGTALAAMYKAIRQSYECLANDTLDPLLGKGGAEAMMKAAQKSSGFEKLLEIERRTMKD
jgi:methylisocitrate lyase